MTNLQHERVKDVLLKALQAAPGSRLEILAAEDGEIRAEVERLLGLSEEMGGFLESPAIQSPAIAAPPELIGSIVDGRYRLDAILGAGGFGTVFRAHDQRLDRFVALKVLHAGVLSESTLRAEIRALSKIDHPGIVAALDAGRLPDGRFFLVTRFISGKTLGQILSRRGVIDPVSLQRWGLEFAEALAEAHRHHVLHLDLKPENLMLEDAGPGRERAVILDFGIGTMMAEDVAFRSPGSPTESATLQYCDDVRSLTSLLFLAMTGKALTRESLANLPLRRWRMLFRGGLTDAGHTGFQTALELRQALSRVRNSSRRTLAFATLAVTLAGLASLYLAVPERKSVAHFPLPVPLTTLPGEESFPALSPDGRTVFFASNRSLYSLEIGGTEPKRLTAPELQDTSPACSPDGRTLAFLRTTADGQIRLMTMPASGGAPTELAKGIYGTITWAPHGRSLAISAGVPKRILLLDLASREWHVLSTPPTSSRGDSDPAFSPDGRTLMFVRRYSGALAQVYRLQLNDYFQPAGDPRGLGQTYADVGWVTWSPDGRSIYFLAGNRSNHGLWRLTEGVDQPAERILEAGEHLQFLCIARSAWRMVMARDQDDANIWRADLAAPGGPVASTRQIVASTWEDEEQTLSPDEKTISFTSNRTGVEQIWLSGVDGSQPRQLTSFRDSDNIQSFWAKGEVWVTGNLDLQLTSVLLTPAGSKPRRRNSPARAIGISRDASHLYIASLQSGKPSLARISIDGRDLTTLAKVEATRAIEAPDGMSVYYWLRSRELWRVPVSGGDSIRILDGVDRRAYAVGRNGVYFATGGEHPSIRYYRFSDRSEHDVMRLNKPVGFGFDVSADERSIFYTQFDQQGADLFLAENFGPASR